MSRAPEGEGSSSYSMFWSGVVRKSKHNTEENNDSLAEKPPLCTRHLQLWEAHKNSSNVLVLINKIANNKVSAKHFLSLLMSDAHSFPLPLASLAFDIKSFVLAGR